MSRALRWLPTLVGVALALVASAAMAQIKTDDTLGRIPRELQGRNYAIGSELGRITGQNLFHSFERFSLDTDESATFSGPNDIRNVISRVTGGQRSDIDGTIKSIIPGADFYFINPAGIVFRENAKLQVSGSFQVSTADEVRFPGDARFSATDPDTSAFSVDPPEAFGFLGANPAPITVDASFLQVVPGEALSLVGGDVDVGRADIRAEAGRITLSAVGGPGEARLGDGDIVAARRADVTLREGSRFSTTGDGGGTIRIRAGRFEVMDESFLSANNNGASDSRGGVDIDARDIQVRDGAFFSVSALAGGDAGTMMVEADRLTIDGADSDAFTGIASDVRDGAEGRGGLVNISTTDLSVLSGGKIQALTFGVGAAGTVEVDVKDRLFISGAESPFETGILSAVREPSIAVGGSVTVAANDVDLRADGVIRSVTFGRGKAGTVTVTADRVTLRGGGQISSSTLEEGTGESGDVVLTAHETLSIFGQSRVLDEENDVFPPSGVFASTESERPDARAGGTVTVTAPVIRLADSGEIASEVFGGGAGGAVEVHFEDLLEVDEAEITTKADTVDAGDVRISGRGVIDVRNNGEISTTVVKRGSGGNAGDITIDPRFIILDRGKIQANGRRGQGGNIRITVDNLIQSPDSTIEALSEEGGIDGTVVISTPEADLSGGLVVLEGALLDAASQLRERCASRRDVGASSFTGVGRGGLPPSPDGPLGSAYPGASGARRANSAAPQEGARAPAEEPQPAERASWPAVAGLAPCHGAF
jgi:filamentous hemagglutinin family protein